MFAFRLVAYAANGPKLGLLPDPLTASVSFPRNDVGALRIMYADIAAGGPILRRGLGEGLEVAVEVADGDEWVEPPGARFVLIGRRKDLADQAGTVDLTLPSYGWLLGKARNLETANLLPADHSEAGKRPFYSATAGTILTTLLQENTARGGVPVARDFAVAVDSAGAPWSLDATLYYDLGLDLLTILRNLADQGMVDWTTQGRTLQVWNPGVGVDRSQSVILRLGRDIKEAPSDESIEGLLGRVLLRGSDGLIFTESNPEAPTPWGVWEGYIAQGGVSDQGTASTLMQASLQASARVRGQYTRDLVLRPDSAVPMIDYLPGDWVTAPTWQDTEKVRVQQVTLVRTTAGYGGNVVLHDRIVDAEILRARRVTGIVGGAVLGGVGGVPTPANPAGALPAAPVGVVVEPSAYIDAAGRPAGLASVTWNEVTTSTTGLAMEVAGYRAAWRPNRTGEAWRDAYETAGTSASFSGLPVDGEVVVRVQAQGGNRQWGPWSAEVVAAIPSDLTPPEAPSVPVISSGPGVVRVGWDGANHAGGGMPTDFSHVEVAVGETAEPPTVGVLAGAGTVIVPMPTGQTAYVRLRAVDTSGNVSDWSTIVNIRVASVLDDIDLTAAREDGSLYVDGTIAGRAIIGGTITSDLLAAGAVQAEHVDAGAIKAEHLEIGAVSRDRLASDVTGSLASADAWAERTVLEPGRITITGAVGSTAYMTLTATAQEWWAGGVRVAYTDADAQEMGIRSARIEQTLQVGRHVIESYNSEVTIVRWVG